jgi:cysteinyl-tRNA synthetase
MIDGARVEVAEYKKSPRDFVLWKPSDNDSFGWDSPWGYGRPGWHIECTSMIKKIIGDDCTLDIHGGGNDLIFPHHENEIAQGSCISTSKYCNYWFHNGIVLVNKKKMSKSLGNVILLDDLLKEHSSSVIRLALLSAHYRQPLNWTEQTIINAKNLYKKLVSAVDASDILTSSDLLTSTELHGPFPQCAEIQDILSDDLNTPEVINYLSRLAKTARNNTDDALKLAQSMKFIGLDLVKPSYKTSLDDKYIINLIKQRDEYRIKKDFGSADEVRDKLLDMGIELRDSDGKTTWKYTED